LEFYDLEEDEKIKCTVWAFEATKADGVIQNCQRGFRFNVALNSLIEFTDNLEQELKHILK
jgi:hypothetical protein